MRCATCIVIRRVIGIAIVAIVFSLTARYAWVALVATMVLGVVPAWRERMWSQAVRIVKSMDRLLAAQLFASGDETVTFECAERRTKLLFCRATCWLAGLFDPGHCERSGTGQSDQPSAGI